MLLPNRKKIKEESFDYNLEAEKRKNEICHIICTGNLVVSYDFDAKDTEEEIKKAALEDSKWVEEGYQVTDPILFVNWSEKGNCSYATVITNFDAPPLIGRFPNQVVSEIYKTDMHLSVFLFCKKGSGLT